MRSSILLALLGLVCNLAFGFSSQSSPLFLPSSAAFGVPKSKTTNIIMTPSPKKTRRSPGCMKSLVTTRGGASDSTSEPSKCPMRKLTTLTASLYGTTGVMYILVKAIRRVVPIALEPFAEGAVPLTQLQLGIYAATCLWFAYVEGYKGFQLKFSPLVVSRSFTLEPGYAKLHHFLLAPLYSMGLFHATKKRMIVSWSVTMGVAAIVAIVKRFPYPWRNIVDAGVVAGLTWGCASMMIQYVKALMTGQVPADPALPVQTAK